MSILRRTKQAEGTDSKKGGEKLFCGEDRGGPGGKCGDNPKDYEGDLKT